MITLPVALAAYAGASIADCSPSKTGLQAFLLAIPGLAVAWTMILHPALVV